MIHKAFAEFEYKEIKFEGRNAIIVFPKKSNGHLVLKTEYFGAFPEVEIELLHRGFTLIHIDNTNRWGTEDNTDRQYKFVAYVSKEYQLNSKCVLIGMSCGGMQAVYFAAKYPKSVSVMYLDAPVMNLCSCPGNMGIAQNSFWEEFEKSYGFSKSKLLIYRNHPMDKIPILVENEIPIIMVYGDADSVVPYEENGIVLEKYYKDNDKIIKIIKKENCGHHPHGLDDPAPIVDFILTHVNGVNERKTKII